MNRPDMTTNTRISNRDAAPKGKSLAALIGAFLASLFRRAA